MRRTLFSALAPVAMSAAGLTAVLTAAAPALAQIDAAASAQLSAALENERRAEDRARDPYRNPAETLAFFGVGPGMTIAEYAPGGGWYTRVLAPYVATSGRYIAIGGDTDSASFNNPQQEQNTRAWPRNFPAQAAGWTGIDAARIAAFESDEVPDDIKGHVDRVLIFRSLHGLMGANRADSELRNLREVLADDGMVGVVQHRARADAPYAYANGSNGYLREEDVVKLFEINGFELVEKSEVNANPADPADWQGGVWSLPPNLSGAPDGSEERARRMQIGESDRMTMLFRKRA